MRWLAGRVAALLILVLAGAVDSAAAQVTFTEGLGTSLGSTPRDSRCPDGSMMTGIRGSVSAVFGNTVVGSAAALCTAQGQTTAATRMGNHPGADADSSCPSGQVVTGVSGRSGDLVDAAAVRCQLQVLGAPIGAGTDGASIGGGSGGPRGPFTCPTPTVAVGLDGDVRVGGTELLDFVRLICVDIRVSGSPSSPRPAPAERSCAGRPAAVVVSQGLGPFIGSAGNDVIVGSAANDGVLTGAGDDVVCAEGGADRLFGGSGRDRLEGGTGNDRLNGWSGRDTLLGGSGRDHIDAAGRERDRVDCGPGRDGVRIDRLDRIRRCERVRRVGPRRRR